MSSRAFQGPRVNPCTRCAHRDDGVLDVLGAVGRLRDDATGGGQVTKQAAGSAVGRVHGAQEAPGLRQKLPHCRRAQLREVGAPVNRPEVGQVPGTPPKTCIRARVMKGSPNLLHSASFNSSDSPIDRMLNFHVKRCAVSNHNSI